MVMTSARTPPRLERLKRALSIAIKATLNTRKPKLEALQALTRPATRETDGN
jgi:hypothetical protein